MEADDRALEDEVFPVWGPLSKEDKVLTHQTSGTIYFPRLARFV